MRHFLQQLALILVVTISLLPAADAAHITGTCLECHNSGANPRTMANVCNIVGCHDTAPRGAFTADKASNAMGSHPTPPSATKQTSHFWGGATTDQLSAGSSDPPLTFYFSRAGISKNRLTCSRCHDPHKAVGNNKLLRKSRVDDLICQQCHAGFYVDNPKALKTHPIGNLTTATYAAFYTADPTPKKFKLTADVPNNAAQGITLINGYVSCSSCHAPHFADSDSSTIDSLANVANLQPGDGHLLRADGPTRTNKSALCQTCHTYKEHGKVGNNAVGSGAGDAQIGCLVCHSGHSYDATAPNAPNYFVLRKIVDSGIAGYGSKTGLLYTTYPTSWATYCTSCHGAVTGYTLRPHSLPADNDCTICHAHNATTYSFAQGGSGSSCSSCHGAPPRTNNVADRVDNTNPDTGYAIGQNGIHYNWPSPTQNFKDETRTPHKRHSGALNADKAAVDYAFGFGTTLSACLPCHNDKEDAVNPGTPTHDKADSNGSFQDVEFSSMATFSGVLTAPLYKKTAGSQWMCSGIYCHSNGGKRTTTGGAKVFADFKTATTPAWPLGSNNTTNIGTIVGIALECQQCHGVTVLTMNSSNKYNSQTHNKHLTKFGDSKTSCYLCHSDTVDSNGAVPALARDHRTISGTHVNGTPNVHFADTAVGSHSTFGTDLAPGTYNGAAAAGTCTVYCHSNGKGTTVTTPDWDLPATGACGACHSTVAAALSAPHAKHLSITLPTAVTCNDCHFTVAGDATLGTHTGHVNGEFTFSQAACNSCHGWTSGEKVPVWGETPINDQYCLTCHTGTTTGLVKTKTAPNKEAAKTRGHNATANYTSGNLPGNKLCTSCHLSTFANHVDGTTGNATGLVAAATTCTTSCHGVGGTAIGANTKGIVTHFDRACKNCHDPHGDTTLATNIYMVRSVSTGTGNYSGAVDFRVKIGANSYDESDAANADDLCATCHTYGSGALSDHNTKTNAGIAHHEGENCFTASCHKTHQEAGGAFISGGGSGCNGCHGNPPATGAHRPTRGDRTLENDVTNPPRHSRTATHELAEDRTDCAKCHTGADLYTFDASLDRASAIAGRRNHGNTVAPYNRATILPATVSYGTSGNFTYCSTACHISSATDGYWFDKSAGSGPSTWNKDSVLNCTACHYYVAGATSSANNTAATPKDLKGSHNVHFAKTKPCTSCHGAAPTDTTHISIPLTGTDLAKIQNRAAAVQDEAAVLGTIATQSDPGNETCSGAGVGLGCHNTKISPAWTTTGITCTNCHIPGGGAAADPASGLHNMATAGVQKHDNTLRAGCTECHASMTSDPATHIDGTWQADSNANMSSGQPRFLSGTRTALVYGEGVVNASTCWDNGIVNVTTGLDYNGGASCHRDNGVWKRLWSNDANDVGTTPGSPRCKVCHGQYTALNSNQGGGWNEGTSHYLTEGGRASIRGETHNSRVLGDASACEDCHSFPSVANHENTLLTMNDGGATIINDSTTSVYCSICHATGNPLSAGTFTFTKSTAFTIEKISGAYDPKSQCNSCHGAGGSGRYWPFKANGDPDVDNNVGRHEIHMDRLAKKVYTETVAQLLTDNSVPNPGVTSDTKQKNLCEYCHTAPSGFSGHHLEALPAEVVIANLWNKGVDSGATYAGVADTCTGVNCHNNKLTVDNSYGWYDATTGAGCVVCHTVGGVNALPNNIHPNSGLHNITPTVTGVRHDDSFSTSGTCASCHTGIVSAMVGSTHINGTAVADSGVNTNAERGLFAAYSEAAINSGTCAGSGVDNTVNCHADGGTWSRRWSTTVFPGNGVTECANCHGDFTSGWRWINPAPAGTTDHSDPSALNAGDAMGVALKHPDCQICHGWGKGEGVYSTTWHNKTPGAVPGHGDGRITMNGPQPSTGAGYNEGTGGCAAACHLATWVMSDSGLTVNYGNYGGGSCDTCHGVVGTGQFWPDGSGGAPAYADDNVNSAARHTTHLTAIAQYKWTLSLTALKADSTKQKEACAFCHPIPGESGHNDNVTPATIVAAGSFQKFTGSTNSATDTASGAYSGGTTRSCANLVCHNLVTSPTAAADSWEGTTAANCTTLCHGPNTVVTAREGHQKHVVTKGYGCLQCHPANTGLYGHINGMVNILFTNATSLEQTYGSGNATYTKGSVAFNRNPVTSSTCTLVYCHADKTTPAWNTAIAATGCVSCHTSGGAGNNPTSGLHAMTATNVTKHDSTLRNGCTECHASLTSDPASHIDGTWQADTNTNQSGGQPRFLTGTRTAMAYSEGAANSSTCWDNGVINITTGLDYNGGVAPGCHRDNGVWKRLWSTAANVDTQSSKNPGQLVCDVCHGQYQSLNGSSQGWREGSVHYRSGAAGIAEDKGKGHNQTSGQPVANACDDCHAYPAASGVHENSALNFSGGAGVPGTYTLTMGTSGWYCATCHNAQSAEVATLTSSHTLPDSTAFATRTYVVGTTQPIPACSGCHINVTGEFWPDGAVSPDRAGEHPVHVLEIAKKLYATGSPSIAQQNTTCNYCHPGNTHGGVDSANDGTPDLELGSTMKKIIGAGADSNGFWRRSVNTCSSVACHAGSPFTPHWYADTTAPGNVTLTAVAGPVPRSIKVSWTAVGDDGTIDGTAYKYDMRMATTSANAINFALTNNYVQGVPTVKRMGTLQETIIHNVNPSTTYYFSLRTYDTAGNFGITANSGQYVSYAVTATPDLVAPVMTGSPQWYGIDTARVLDQSGTVKLGWSRAEDHTMPITYDIWWSTGAINYGLAPSASTKDSSFRVTGLTNDQSYTFAVRAKDAAATPNRDTNIATLMAVPKGLATVPKTGQVLYANGALSGTVPMSTTVYTTTGTSTALSVTFLAGAVYHATAQTNVYADTFAIYIANANAVSTVTAELGYWDTAFRSFTATAPVQTVLSKQVTLASRAKKVIPFKFGEMRWVPGNAKLAVKLTQTQAGTINWGSATNRGDLTTQIQPVNVSPTTPTITTNAVSGANVSFYWAAATDTADSVGDTVHYDVYGDDGVLLPGTFPYLIASGLTTNATSGAPLIWDTQASGIALAAQNTTVRVRVEAGDSINGKTLSHTAATSGNLTVNNSGDNVAPGTITNFKAETRPKQGSIYLSWTAPGDDGSNNGRANSYDIRWSNAVIDDETKFTNATQLISEPYPDFAGYGQGYEVLGLASGNYYFAIKAVDEGAKTSPRANTAALKAAGPKCGICHSTPPDETASVGNHAKHGFTMTECGNCHGTEAATFATDHQDGAIKLGWKTATPVVATPYLSGYKYTQGIYDIYTDGDGSGGFNPLGDNMDDGSCANWSTQQVSGCHGPATSATWTAAATLVCSACHGDNSRVADNFGNSFDDPSSDVKSSPPVDNHGYDGSGVTEGERKYVGAHVAHLNYSFRLSKGDSCRLCHGSSRPGVALHADGIIDIKFDLAAAGATANWAGGTPSTAGTCATMSPDSCHPSTATPKWDSAQTFACTNCHGMASTTPSHVTDPNKLINLADNDADSGDPMPGNCTWCHVGGHPKENIVSAITNATTAAVTTASNHNLVTGNKVTIHTQTGMTGINNMSYLVTVTDATHFTLTGCNSTGFGTFTTGTWIKGSATTGGIILLPNDSRVGINYASGGVHLKANIGTRGEKTSEAELCWGCHVANSISEWGADSVPTNVPTLPGNGNNYNYGTISTQATTGNWIGATWTSGTTGTYGFGYKTSTIKSTHSTDTTGTTALTGSAYNYSNGGVDVVGKIHCSNCHDVHNSNKSPLAIDGLDPTGAPYLRGTWKSNPYKEDGAPILGQTYTAATVGQPGLGYGAVPRANPSTSQAMGGYWIDQNSGNPTAGWSYESSAGLCQLCHGTSVDGLDYAPSGAENLWISAINGHANSALGGSGTGAANIFFNGTGGRKGTGGAQVIPNPGAWMGFQNSLADTSNRYGYGPRSTANVYLAPLQTPSKPDLLSTGFIFGWGVTVDAATTEVGYHQFSCSKCHNPHASRLPKLMITNCLDVTHNTWDNSYNTLAINPDWSIFNTADSSWSTMRLSHLSTAQNCHRYIDLDGNNTPDEKGWNKVTPW